MNKAKLLLQCDNVIGEAATWLKLSDVFLWLDIAKGTLYQYDEGENKIEEHYFQDYITSVIPFGNDNDKVVLAMKNRFILYSLSQKSFSDLADITFLRPNLRTNDCKASPAGNIWFGVMDMQNHHETGALYKLDGNLKIHKMLDRQSIPNGLVWNKDATKMFYADSGRGCVEEYAYDKTTDSIQFIRKAVEIPGDMGVPDGMTIDDNDNLWIAQWGGFSICVWNPVTSQQIGKIDLPVPNVASCTFGGKAGDKLFITTATDGLSKKELDEYPLSGSLFVADVNGIVAGENHYPYLKK